MAVDIAKVYIDAEDRTSAAWDSASRNVRGFVDKIAAARTALVGIGSALGAAAGLTAIVESSIKARAEMHELSEMTGLTVERLSQIKPVAEAAGKSLNDIAEAVAKFDKFVQSARNDPKSSAASLLSKLGIDFKSGSADQVLDQFIKKMGEYNASIGKTAALQEALGKGGARYAAVIRDVNEAGTQAIKVNQDQANEAKRTEQNINNIAISFRGARDAIGAEFIPAVSAVTQALLDMRKQSEAAGDKVTRLLGLPLREWAALGAIGFGLLVDTIRAAAAGIQLVSVATVVAGQKFLGFVQIGAAQALWLQGQWGLASQVMATGEANLAQSSGVMSQEWDNFRKTMDDPTFMSKVVDALVDAQARMDGFNKEVKKGTKDFPDWSTAGAASMKAQITLIEKTIELAKARRDAELNLRLDLTQRALADEEYFHNASIHGEEEYINRKAAIRTQAAQIQVQLARNAVSAEQQILDSTLSQEPTDQKDRVQWETKVVEQRTKLVTVTTALTKAQRDLRDVEKDRGQQLVVMDVKVREQMIAIGRETADYTRALEQQIDEMRFQVDLIGQSEVAQKKANLERQITKKLAEDILKVERDIADLERHKDDPALIAERRRQIEKMRADAAKAIEEIGPIIEQEFNRNVAQELGAGIADALLTGGKKGGLQLKDFLIAEFKKLVLKPILDPIFSQTAAGAMRMIGFSPSSMGGSGGMGYGIWTGGNATSMSYTFGQDPQAILDSGGTAGMGTTVDFGGMMGGATIGAMGGVGAHALGAGARGQQAGQSWGMGIGAVASVFTGPIIGGLIGALAGSVIGKFTDPHGDANRSASFGNSASGNYSFSGASQFGTFGTFADKWFSDKDMGPQMRAFMAAQAKIEDAIAAALRPGELDRVRGALSGAAGDFSFGQEHTDFSAVLGSLSQDRLSKIVEALMPGMGKLVTAAQGTGAELLQLVDALFQLRDAGKSIEAAVAQVSGTAVEQIKFSMDALETQVSKGQAALDSAIAANDPAAILGAEQTLTQAVVNRYQTEMNMIANLQQAIRQLDDAAYQFAINIAQRINTVGGSRDIGAIAMGRANTLRGQIGSGPLANQIQDIQGYVGAIDTWYQARRSQIERDMQAQQAAAQAMAQAQQAAAQARVQQLQAELATASQFQAIVNRTQQMLDDMRLSSDNPLPVEGRLGLAGQDVAALRDKYHAATGADRAAAASALLDALQAQRQLGQEAFQRPSPEWQALYNEIMVELTSVQDDAKTVAEQAVELQKQILEVQQQAAQYQAAAASAGQASSAALDALNQEAQGYYTYAEEEGARLYAEQRRQHYEQLQAITGGMEVELFSAQRLTETVNVLKSIDARIAAWFASGGTAGGASGTPVNITVSAPPSISTEQVLNAIARAPSTVRRLISTS